MDQNEPLLDGVFKAISLASTEVFTLFESKDFTVTQKAVNDPLSTADLRSNEILKTQLTNLLPQAAWISEESDLFSDRLNQEFAWIVDPIDGTKEFVAGVPEFSISVGLVQNGRPIMGAVAMPAEDLIVFGAQGLGVFIFTNSQKSKVNSLSTVSIEKANILVSSTEFKNGALTEVSKLLHIQPTGSVARKLALVAAGRADANISLYPKNEWDICGGCALIEALGGLTLQYNQTNKQWQPHRFNQESLRSFGLIAASKQLAAQIADRHIKEGWPIHKQYHS